MNFCTAWTWVFSLIQGFEQKLSDIWNRYPNRKFPVIRGFIGSGYPEPPTLLLCLSTSFQGSRSNTVPPTASLRSGIAMCTGWQESNCTPYFLR